MRALQLTLIGYFPTTMTVGTEPLGLGAQLEFEFAAKKGILEKATLYGVFRAARHKIASDLKIKVIL